MGLKDNLLNLKLPKSKKKRFRLFYRAFFISLGFISVYIMTILIAIEKPELSIIPAFFVLFSTLCEFVLGEVVADNKYPSRTEKIMVSIEDKLPKISTELNKYLIEIIQRLNGCNKNLVNITLHLKVEVFSNDGESLEDSLIQILPYLNLNSKITDNNISSEKQWRTTLSYKGVIGRCLRSGSPEHVNFSTIDEFKLRMIKEFGFSRKELVFKNENARSFYAHPIKVNEEDIIGVLYLFSPEPQVFPRSLDENISHASLNLSRILRIGEIIEDGFFKN